MDNRAKIELKVVILIGCLVVALSWWIFRVTMSPIQVPVTALSSASSPIPQSSLTTTQTSPDHNSLLHNQHPTNSITGSSPAPSSGSAIPTDPTAGMPVLHVSETPETSRPDTIKRVRIVRANFKYPLWRVEELVMKAPAGNAETIQSRNIMIADHVMIRLNPEAEPMTLEVLVQEHGLTIRKAMKMPGCYLISIPDESTSALPRLLTILGEQKGLIRYVEPDYVVQSQQTIPNDPKFGLLWGLNNNPNPAADISAPQIWDLTTGDKQFVIASIDTGIDYNHPDLASNIWYNTAETLNGQDDDGNGYVDDIRGWNFVDATNTPMDGQGHGTHTAGTMGAVGNNGIGVAGVNWHCQLMPLRFLDNTGNGIISDAADALHYVADFRRRGVNIKITNNSWGGGGYSSTFKSALAENAALGILFMAAAGNDAQNNDQYPFYPSSYNESNILAIAATDGYDALANFSHYGSNSVHLAAPGVDTYSTLYGGRYSYMSGTSMATPHVAGVAALLWSLWPTARADDIRDAILKGVDVIPALIGKTITGGRLNARKSVDALFRIVHTFQGNAFNTGAGYPIEFEVGPSVLTDTHQLFVYWSANGSSNFTAVASYHVSNALFRAFIPEFPETSTIKYWIQAVASNGSIIRLPANAPTNTFDFTVVPPVSFLVSGIPSFISSPTPDYGEQTYPSGKVVHASVPAATPPTNGMRWACSGWLGTGSVPASGTTNVVTFTLTTNSSLTWQWQAQFALTHTSLSTRLNTTTWWAVGTTATSLSASVAISINSIPHRFAGWALDGARQPDMTSPAVNPVTGILMSAPHQVTALYVPEAQDSDGNGMNDWWELLYLGRRACDPNDDPDGDGFNNLSEFRDQTNPNDSNHFPTPPVITHTPLTYRQPLPAPYTISAIITDNFKIVSTIMYWSRNGGPESATPMKAGAGQVFTASIPAPGTNGDSFVYSIVAADPLTATTNGLFNMIPSYPEIQSSPSSYNPLLLPSTTSNLMVSVTNSGVGAWHGNVAILWGGLSNDVENGAGAWAHSGSNDLWNISTNQAFSLAQAWYCGEPGASLYAPSMHSKLDSAPFYVTPGAQLTFRQWIKCELDGQFWRPGWKYNNCWDGGIIEISTNNGASFKQISPIGGYSHLISGYAASPWPDGTPCFAGDGSAWTQPTFDLSSFDGCVAVIRFHFGSDDNTEETGWFIDDIVVSPTIQPQAWLTPVSTNLMVPSKSAASMPFAILDSTDIPTGDRTSVLWIAGNTITNLNTFIPVHLKVRSPANLTWFSAGQTSTNGTGQITLTNILHDADGDSCLASVEWSAIPGVWSNTWLTSVQSTVGSATLTGDETWPLSNLLTRSEAGLVTNRFVSVWDSQSAECAIVFSSNTLLRARTWDGLFLSSWVTSQPFMVDNEAPPTPPHLFSLVHQTNAWSKNSVMSLRWDAIQEARGSGVTNYLFGTTTNFSVLVTTNTTTGLTGSPPPLSDGTNHWGWTRARDRMGNLSVPAFYGPCWIDVTPPSAVHAGLTLKLSPYGNYVVGSNSMTGVWSNFTDGAGSGISGYYFAPTNAGGTTKGSWTTNTQGLISSLLTDRTNTMYVWAKDQSGWIGQAAYASFMALSPNSDWDHDGVLNWQEEVSGTDALLGGSVFQLGTVKNVPGLVGSFTLQWPGLTNRHYTISYKDTLGASGGWINLPGATDLSGTTGIMSYTDNTLTHPSRFYRISVRAP
jgi:subtilisin family serine protease